ncbi:MAG: hypothetical protein IJT70_08365 [Clostridia bacterium]|nr:hypothetical protein [Clostridia bacterium]
MNNDVNTDVKVKRKLNIIPKIVCLVLAVIIWYYVMQVDNPDYKQTFTGIKVNLVNTDELTNRGLSIFTGTSYNADITVSGKKSVINNYTSDDITVNADVFKNYKSAGMQVVELDVTLPNGLTLVDQDNSISVFVDEKMSAKIPVTVDQRTGATTSADYETGTLIPEFAEVTVKGPKTIVENIDHATVRADFSSFGLLESTVTTEGTVSLFNADGDELSSAYITLDYPTMKVTYPISLTKQVKLGVTFKYGYFNDSNVSVEIDPAEVTVKGDATAVKNLDVINIAVIDEKQIEKDKTLTFEITPPDDEYTFADEDFSTASVTITNVGTSTKIFRTTALDVIGGDKSCKISEEYLDVTLRGTPEQLASVSADDIKVTVDLTDYNGSVTGETLYDATVTLPAKYEGVYEIGSYKLTVSVDK